MMRNLFFKYKPLVLYAFFGVLTTLVNVVSYYILFNVSGVPNVPATILAWLFAVIFAFVTNKLWVFESRDFSARTWVREGISFFVCRILTGILDVAIMWFAVDRMQWNALAWKIVSNALVIILNYVASKCVIFVKGK